MVTITYRDTFYTFFTLIERHFSILLPKKTKWGDMTGFCIDFHTLTSMQNDLLHVSHDVMFNRRSAKFINALNSGFISPFLLIVHFLQFMDFIVYRGKQRNVWYLKCCFFSYNHWFSFMFHQYHLQSPKFAKKTFYWKTTHT